MDAPLTGPRSLRGLPIPWELRLGLLLPLPPVVVGGLAAAIVLALHAAAFSLLGVPIRDIGGDIEGAIGARHPALSPAAHDVSVAALTLGFVLAAVRLSFTTVGRDLESLARSDASIGRRLSATPSVLAMPHVLPLSRLSGLAGLAIGLGVAEATGWQSAAVVLPLSWTLGRGAYLTVQGARFAASLAPAASELDVLDLRHMRIFGRIGLRLALLWIIGMTLFSFLTLFDSASHRAATLLGLGAGTLLTVAIASLAFVIPTRTIRQRIRLAKRMQLGSVDAKARRVRDAALTGDAAAYGRLADLLAYRAYVESVREWPIDTSMLLRFTLYLLIPLGSWVSGALVERLVDAVLD